VKAGLERPHHQRAFDLIVSRLSASSSGRYHDKICFTSTIKGVLEPRQAEFDESEPQLKKNLTRSAPDGAPARFLSGTLSRLAAFGY
jgi:hypothetical protein